MRLILYKWGGFNEDILHKNLILMGHDVAILEQPCMDYNTDMSLAMKIMEFIRNNHAEGVISFNFFPIVSVTCNAVGVRYFSWIYDSPHTTLFSNAVMYDTNCIGVFDSALVDELTRKGVGTVKHVPLAVDCEEFDRRIKNANIDSIDCVNGSNGVAFVGSLYTEKNNYYDKYKEADLALGNNLAEWKSLDSLLESQTFEYCNSYINDESNHYAFLEQKVLDDGINLGADYFATTRDIVIKNILERKVTVIERQELIDSIFKVASNNHFAVNLYTSSKLIGYKKLEKINRGTVDYISQMPWVFSESGINLNITLRSIRTGIPLRALDIIGCGGFLLSNYQSELEESFKDDVEISMYRSKEECLEKVLFYNKNEKARDNVARNGREKICREFSYQRMLPMLLQTN